VFVHNPVVTQERLALVFVIFLAIGLSIGIGGKFLLSGVVSYSVIFFAIFLSTGINQYTRFFAAFVNALGICFQIEQTVSSPSKTLWAALVAHL
jgi:hypothetical protein